MASICQLGIWRIRVYDVTSTSQTILGRGAYPMSCKCPQIRRCMLYENSRNCNMWFVPGLVPVEEWEHMPPGSWDAGTLVPNWFKEVSNIASFRQHNRRSEETLWRSFFADSLYCVHPLFHPKRHKSLNLPSPLVHGHKWNFDYVD